MSVAFWFCAALSLVSASVSFGYAAAGARVAVDAARPPALYALARSTALVAVAIIAIFSGATPFVAAVAVAMIFVQTLDALIGASIRDRIKTVGPALTAAANAAALVWLLAS